MGVTQLWSTLAKEPNLLQKWAGKEDHATIVTELEHKVVAVDLSMWLTQAMQQGQLAQHFSATESAIKVAFERSMQLLRHGVIPVIVVDGKPPEEKRIAQQKRFEARNGYAGGGHGHGSTRWTQQSRVISGVLQHMGLPVVEAPGEAEATCAALVAIGAVDAGASFDSDVLVYGAAVLYPNIKLSSNNMNQCELSKITMDSVRAALGIQTGGEASVCLIAMLAGSDYSLKGAEGVGAAGALTLVKYLLQHKTNDSDLMADFANLIRRPSPPTLSTHTKCTGCSRCGHEGGRSGSIKQHTAKNPCSCCPDTHDGVCTLDPHAKANCRCPYHRTQDQRKAERIADKIRATDAETIIQGLGVFKVYGQQYEEALNFVKRWMRDNGVAIGQKLQWKHRPRVVQVAAMIAEYNTVGLDWGFGAVRKKMMPILFEWDIQHPAGRGIEFRPTEIVKVSGTVGGGGTSGSNGGIGRAYKLLLKWERIPGRNVENITQLLEKNIKKSKNSGNSGGDDDDFGFGGGTQTTQPADAINIDMSQYSLFNQTQQITQIAVTPGGARKTAAPQTEMVTVEEFDVSFVKECEAQFRCGRKSVVDRHYPELEKQYQDKLAGKNKKKKCGGGRSNRVSKAATASQQLETTTQPTPRYFPQRASQAPPVLPSAPPPPQHHQQQQHDADPYSLVSPESAPNYELMKRLAARAAIQRQEQQPVPQPAAAAATHKVSPTKKQRASDGTALPFHSPGHYDFKPDDSDDNDEEDDEFAILLSPMDTVARPTTAAKPPYTSIRRRSRVAQNPSTISPPPYRARRPSSAGGGNNDDNNGGGGGHNNVKKGKEVVEVIDLITPPKQKRPDSAGSNRSRGLAEKFEFAAAAGVGGEPSSKSNRAAAMLATARVADRVERGNVAVFEKKIQKKERKKAAAAVKEVEVIDLTMFD